METNKDLLLCENKYYLEKSKLENILDFSKEPPKKPEQLKTEKISSSKVISQVRSFLDKIKTDDPLCVNIEQNDEDEEENSMGECDENASNSKKKIQLDLLLFERDDDTSSSDSDDDN